jgi:hypothetical protein
MSRPPVLLVHFFFVPKVMTSWYRFDCISLGNYQFNW